VYSNSVHLSGDPVYLSASPDPNSTPLCKRMKALCPGPFSSQSSHFETPSSKHSIGTQYSALSAKQTKQVLLAFPGDVATSRPATQKTPGGNIATPAKHNNAEDVSEVPTDPSSVVPLPRIRIHSSESVTVRSAKLGMWLKSLLTHSCNGHCKIQSPGIKVCKAPKQRHPSISSLPLGCASF